MIRQAERSQEQRAPQGAAGPALVNTRQPSPPRPGRGEPHKCGVPGSFGTPHLSGSEEFRRAPIRVRVVRAHPYSTIGYWILNNALHPSLSITFYKAKGPNRLWPPLHPPTILGTKTAPFFAILSSGSVDYQRLTTIWEPPPYFYARKHSVRDSLLAAA